MANRYWVGGSGNWSDDDNHWATSSGGSPGDGNIPTASDNAIFDANSNATAYTVTINSTAVCLDLNFSAAPSVSGTITWAGTSQVTVSGNLIMLAGMTVSSQGSVAFNASSGTKTITSNGATLNRNVTIQCSGATLQLADNLTMGSTASITYQSGTFDPNGKLLIMNGTSQSISGGLTLYDLTRTGTAAKTDTFQVTNGNLTVTNLLTINGNSAINRILVSSGVRGTSRTITAASLSCSNLDFQDITAAGAASWDLSAITGGAGDAGGNSGITFTTSTTRYAVSAGNWDQTARWATSSGGASGASVPLCHDDVVLDGNSGTGTITQNMPRAGKSINCTGYTGTLTTSTTASVFGSWTMSAGMTLTASTQGYTFEGRSSYTITMAGKAFTKLITLDAPGGTYTLQDVFTNTGNVISVTRGSFIANGNNITGDSISSSNSNTRAIDISNVTVELTGVGTPWNVATSTGLTLTATGSTIKLTNNSASSKTFAGGGKTYGTLWFAPSTGTGSLTLTGSNTFTELKDDGTAAHSWLFTASTTTTFTTWNISGSASHTITIGSPTAANHTLSKSAGTVQVQYLNISRSTAQGGATYDAYTLSGNVDGGNNSGWQFTAPVVQSTRSPSGGASYGAPMMYGILLGLLFLPQLAFGSTRFDRAQDIAAEHLADHRIEVDANVEIIGTGAHYYCNGDFITISKEIAEKRDFPNLVAVLTHEYLHSIDKRLCEEHTKTEQLIYEELTDYVMVRILEERWGKHVKPTYDISKWKRRLDTQNLWGVVFIFRHYTREQILELIYTK